MDDSFQVSEGGQGRSSEALPNLWPWTGQLIYSETKIHRCSATVVSDDMVITAARCFSRRFGFYNLDHRDVFQSAIKFAVKLIEENGD